MAGQRVNTHNMQKQRTIFRAECEAANAPCWMCGMSIDYDAPPNAVESFELDHYYPVSTHPELQEDPANFRASHMLCNRNRGNGAPQPSLGSLSREWFPQSVGAPE